MEVRPLVLVAAFVAGAIASFSVSQVLFSKKKGEKKKLGPTPGVDEPRYGGLTLLGEPDNLFDSRDNLKELNDLSYSDSSRTMIVKPFSFNMEVVKVFDDMVSRSVPLYREVNDFLLYWIHHFIKPETERHVIVDLGCSTGTTFDLIGKSFKGMGYTRDGNLKGLLRFVGVDNSDAMLEKCREKLNWITNEKNLPDVELNLFNADLAQFDLNIQSMKADFVIMNYTLQFIKLSDRKNVLKTIFDYLRVGGILFLSEKISMEKTDEELQNLSTYIYEDFKCRRGYTKSAIARKKEALMNVLIPYTEMELRAILRDIGFIEINLALKWNNFATFTARKPPKLSLAMEVSSSKYPSLDELFDPEPKYFKDILSFEDELIRKINGRRRDEFELKGNLGAKNLEFLESVALDLNSLKQSNFFSWPSRAACDLFIRRDNTSIGEKTDESSPLPLDVVLWLCDSNNLKPETRLIAAELINKIAKDLIPWKKGPVQILDMVIDSEWRSDIKWNRFKPHLPNLGSKTICDIGCNNGYFMWQMFATPGCEPKLVVGIEPSLNCLLQFEFMSHVSHPRLSERLKFEYAKADILEFIPHCFDVVFCLGVLYHTSDPIKMLRDIHLSLKPGGVLFVDCEGIVLNDEFNDSLPLCLFPGKRYTNMKGVYFLPNMAALKLWLQKASFQSFEIIYADKLTSDEQRVSEFAPVNSSLKDGIRSVEPFVTKEGYPGPYRFYIKAKKG